ncbi:MAG: putative transporter, partial [Muribaculaceae bacterium]|nr:putative transporter [Muribaculaceae bacterium]
MEWIHSILFEHSALQALIVLALIIAVGLGLGKWHFKGVSLGVTWVFFVGIIAGHFGLSIDPAMLNFAESFGLVLFVYELGLKVGPGFFSSFRSGGVLLNGLGLGVVIAGTLLAIAMTFAFGVPMQDMVGILSGATTNTPALGAAQQALSQIGVPASGAALSCAVTYPLGVVGVILAFIVIRKLMVRSGDIDSGNHDDDNQTFIAAFEVENPAVFGKTVQQVAHTISIHFVISRIWRDGNVTIPTSDTTLLRGDRLLVVTTEHDLEPLTVAFGKQESSDWNTGDIDWNAIDSSLVSRHVVVSRPSLNGRRLGSLKLRNTYGINITRVLRNGVTLLASPRLVLQLGDRLTVVGEERQIENVAKALGNSTVTLKDPNMGAIFLGIVLGVVLGSVPIAVPGISVPVRLGLAGGPIIVGILVGRFGPQFHLVTYTTRSANLMLRGIGLSLFLGCLGLDAGARFLETILRAEGVMWIGIGFAITVIPVVLFAPIAMRLARLDFGTACGVISGAMANPMALNYANDTLPGDNPAVGYATVYPIAMFSRVVIAQLLVLLFVG